MGEHALDDVHIGPFTLKPGRELIANGSRVPLGKRALDIISVLAAAGGEIVTKDELLRSVWQGAIVEENALQAHIVALRRALGSQGQRLRTIRGVGYQLEIDRREESPKLRPSRAASAEPRRFAAGRLAWMGGIVASGALIVTLGAAAFWEQPDLSSKEITEVGSFGGSGGQPAQLLALMLHDNIAQVLNQSGIEVVGTKPAGFFATAPHANLNVRGAVTQSGGRLHIDLFLDDAASGTRLWSSQLDGTAASSDQLATEASAAVSRTIYAIRELDAQPTLKLDPETVALYVRGAEMMRSAHVLEEGSPREIFEQAVARAPQSAAVHASLAMALAGDARRSEPGVAAASASAAEAEAHKAIALDPAAAGAAYDALYNVTRLEHPRQIAPAEDWLLAGMDKAPLFAFVWMRECRVLSDAGRTQEALPICRRALALHPFAEPIAHKYAWALAEAGQDEQAKEAIDRAFAYNPDHAITHRVRFDLAAFGGRPREALAMLESPSARPEFRQEEAAAFKRYLQNAGRWNQQERRDVGDEIYNLSSRGDMDTDEAVMALTSLGRLDQAFGLLRSSRIDETLVGEGTGFLFQPVTAPLRADPRFWPTAAELGLAQYWVVRGKWPDMCGGQFTLQYCKAEVAKALAQTPRG